MIANTITIGALFTTAAFGAAVPKINLKVRQTTTDPSVSWTSSSTGNLAVVYSDNTVSYGPIQPSVFAQGLNNACYDAGTCDTSPIVSTSPSGEEVEVTVTGTPSGSYPSWVHNGLLDIFMAAVSSVETSSTVLQPGKSFNEWDK